MNTNDITIRLERSEEYREVENLIRESFWNVYRPGCSEHYVIHVLRDASILLGYTINGAKQLGIEDTKGSIEAGKDADYLVFDVDLLTAEHDGFSNLGPSEVYFCGKKMK